MTAAARLRRGARRIWRRIRRRPGWGSPARDAGHQYYRTQYERMLEALPNLPRTRDNETNATFLAFAQVVQQLHEQGDDPILPPGVRRIVVRDVERMAAFGDVGAPRGFMGAAGGLLSGWKVWALAGAITLSGWGVAAVQAALKERVEDQRDEARADLAMTERALIEARETQTRLAEAVRDADEQSAATARTIARERALRVRAEREVRSARNAVEQARAGGPIDYGFGGVRGPGGDEAGPGDNRPADRDPGPVSP